MGPLNGFGKKGLWSDIPNWVRVGGGKIAFVVAERALRLSVVFQEIVFRDFLRVKSNIFVLQRHW